MSLDSTAAGVAYALALIRSRFESISHPDDFMTFHNVDHTQGVVRRTGILLQAMHVPPQDCALGTIAAAFHDVVQRWQENPMPDSKVMRKRFVGQNEADSAAEAVTWMKANGLSDPRQIDLVTAAILGTVPAWDPLNMTVSQPNVTANAHPVVRAVALADLGIPGMDGGAEFVETGDGLFREENLDVARALRRCASRTDLTADVVEGYKTRILGWCRGQVAYARGRQARLPIELGELSGPARAGVETLFSRFEESITTAEKAVQERETLSTWDVLRVVGYAVPA